MQKFPMFQKQKKVKPTNTHLDLCLFLYIYIFFEFDTMHKHIVEPQKTPPFFSSRIKSPAGARCLSPSGACSVTRSSCLTPSPWYSSSSLAPTGPTWPSSQSSSSGSPPQRQEGIFQCYSLSWSRQLGNLLFILYTCGVSTAQLLMRTSILSLDKIVV